MGDFFKKFWWLLIIIIVVLVLIIAWLLFTVVFNKTDQSPAPTATTSATQESNTTTPSSQKIESDEELLKKAVSAKTGIAIESIIVDVSKNTGKYAKGLVSAEGEMGGGYWLALKENGKWTVVFDGQNTPECSLVDPAGFPADMVPECFDASGNIKVRT